jgi:L-fucose mutarotase/ribose pyranase (RbsD/FucU family)
LCSRSESKTVPIEWKSTHKLFKHLMCTDRPPSKATTFTCEEKLYSHVKKNYTTIFTCEEKLYNYIHMWRKTIFTCEEKLYNYIHMWRKTIQLYPHVKKNYTTIFTCEEKLYSHVKKNEGLIPGVSLNHLQPPWLTLSLEISASLMASNAAIHCWLLTNLISSERPIKSDLHPKWPTKSLLLFIFN